MSWKWGFHSALPLTITAAPCPQVQIPDKELDIGEDRDLDDVYRGGQVGGSKRACDDAFDKWVTCLVHSDCFKDKGPNASKADLKAVRPAIELSFA